MHLQLRMFAGAKELCGVDRLAVELPAGATVRQLRAAVAEQAPSLAPLLPSVVFAVDTQYVGEDHVLNEASEVACIPPVSGG